MRTIWHSLAWKEWHEHKWKLAAFTAAMCGVAGVVLWVVRRDLSAVYVVPAMLMVCAVPFSLFLGLMAATGERSRSTLPFVQALPVPMWRVALSKFLAGLATLAVAVVATVLLFYVLCLGLKAVGYDFFAGLREPLSEWSLVAALIPIAVAASLYIWTAAVGVNRKDEVSAGAVVAAVIVGLWTLLFLAALLFQSLCGEYPPPLPSALVASLTPLGFVLARGIADDNLAVAWLGIGMSMVVHLALITWYVSRFGRVGNQEVRSPQPAGRKAGRLDWLAPPRRRPLTAIAWKQFRESLPLVVGGLICIVGAIAIWIVVNWSDVGPGNALLEVVVGISAICGAFLALVFGVATFFYDVEPRANEFWRSRPIGSSQWFGVKFATGLAMFVATVYLPVLIAASLSHSLIWLTGSRDGILIVPMHLALFAAVVAMMCLVRQAIYAVVLGMATVYVEVLAYVGLVLLAGKLFGWNVWAVSTPGDLSMLQIAIGLIVSFVVSILLAWLAVRRDWGWRR